jgi:aldehyde dehydrogenase (NAD+)
VFNLVNGAGAEVGSAISSHPDIDLVSFTGSTRAGVEVARDAAPTIKRVLQELGGKSANILLADVDLAIAVPSGVDAVMLNSGQTCNAPTRMFVPRNLMAAASDLARTAAEAWTVGEPANDVRMGPVANGAQWRKVQDLIDAGICEGATLVTGGSGRPEGLDEGFFVKPTVFADVAPDMRIATEEIFGPVLVLIPYDSETEAIELANATEYGLAGYVSGTDEARCRAVARQLRAGQVFINHAANDFSMPFGGYRRSGNGREWGEHGLREFFEVKAVIGFGT